MRLTVINKDFQNHNKVAIVHEQQNPTRPQLLSGTEISQNKIWNGKYSWKVSKIENHITLISFCLSLAGWMKMLKKESHAIYFIKSFKEKSYIMNKIIFWMYKTFHREKKTIWFLRMDIIKCNIIFIQNYERQE